MDELEAYLQRLAARLGELLGPELVGVYAGGSYALGAYEPGRSDVDVAVVVRSRLTREQKGAVVAGVRHEALPCPARGLELVVYRLAATQGPSTAAAFELNLNSGERMPFRLDYEADPDEEFWFPIDRSILAAHGVALAGPPAAKVFAPIPREQLLPVLAEAIRRQPAGEDARLNAYRALRYEREGVWSSKREAAAWAAALGLS